MKVKITKVFSTDTKKDGGKILDKEGKSLWRVAVKTQQTEDRWLNFKDLQNRPCKELEGQEVEMGKVTDEYGDKYFITQEETDPRYMNEPKGETSLDEIKIAILHIKDTLKRLEAVIIPKGNPAIDTSYDVPVSDEEVNDDSINVEDIPF